MSFYKFERQDIFHNRMKLYPKVHFLIKEEETFYNKENVKIRSGNETILQVPQGHLNLYEMNINREEGAGNSGLIYPYITKAGTLDSFSTVSTEEFQGFPYGDVMSGSYPLSASISTDLYLSSNTVRRRIKSLRTTFDYYSPLSNHYSYETADWNKATQDIKLISIPSIFYGSSIKKGSVKMNFYISGSLAGTLEDINRNGELIQTYGSPFIATPALGAQGTLGFLGGNAADYDNKRVIIEDTAGTEVTFIFDSTGTEGPTGTVDGSGFIIVQVSGFVDGTQYPSEFASAVSSSSLQITTEDFLGPTELLLMQDLGGESGNTTIQDPDSIPNFTIAQFAGGSDPVYTTGQENNGKVAGVVLYNEGFVSITGSWALADSFQDNYLGAISDFPRWIYWGQKASNPVTSELDAQVAESVYQTPSGGGLVGNINPDPYMGSSWDIDFKGTSYVSTLTMMAHAKIGDLNFSNNPTFVDFEDKNIELTKESEAAHKYVEKSDRSFANVVKSYYPNTEAQFEKTTYISKIGIYDKDKNLIAIAKLATPVKKTESRSYTFKMKLDI